MNTYRYQAIDAHGKTSRGMHQAISEEATRQYLSSQGKTAVDIQLKALPFWKRWEHVLLWIPFRKVTVIGFLLELVNLLNSGIPVGRSLQMMAESSSQYRLRLLSRMIYQRLTTGESFWAILSGYQFVLRQLVPCDVFMDSSVGKITTILQPICNQYARFRSFKKTILIERIPQFTTILFSFCLLVFMLNDYLSMVYDINKRWRLKIDYPFWVDGTYHFVRFVSLHWLGLTVVVVLVLIFFSAIFKIKFFHFITDRLVLMIYPFSKLTRLHQKYVFFQYFLMYLEWGISFQVGFSQAILIMSNLSLRKQASAIVNRIIIGKEVSEAINCSRFLTAQEKYIFRAQSKQQLLQSLRDYLESLGGNLDILAVVIGQAIRFALYVVLSVLWIFSFFVYVRVRSMS